MKYPSPAGSLGWMWPETTISIGNLFQGGVMFAYLEVLAMKSRGELPTWPSAELAYWHAKFVRRMSILAIISTVYPGVVVLSAGWVGGWNELPGFFQTSALTWPILAIVCMFLAHLGNDEVKNWLNPYTKLLRRMNIHPWHFATMTSDTQKAYVDKCLHEAGVEFRRTEIANRNTPFHVSVDLAKQHLAELLDTGKLHSLVENDKDYGHYIPSVLNE